MTVRRPTRLTTKFCASAALSLALGAATLATSVPARAADETVPLDKKIFRSILEGLGLKRDGEGINYQERGPLVIPQRLDLPRPEQSDAAAASNPAWPKDPDVRRRKIEEKQERDRDIGAEMELERRPMRPDQLTPGAKTQTVTRQTQTGASSPISNNERLSPSELGYKGNLFNKMFSGKEEAAAKFTGEPPRTSLTAPPPGYQTPSPGQPYGVGKSSEPPKPTDHHTTRGEVVK